MLRHNESYRESDTFALNQKDIIIFLKNLLAENALSQSILTQFCTISFSVFSLPSFNSSALSVFDIKMKIECKGDQYVKTRNNQRL